MENQEGLELIKQLYAQGGWLLGLVGAVVVGIRLYASSAKIQAILPEKYRWDVLPKAGKLGLVFLASLLGTAAFAVVAGAGWVAALVGALPVAIGAVFANEITVAAGSMVDKSIANKKEVVFKSTGAKPDYTPSPYRKAASLVLPIDWKRLPASPLGMTEEKTKP